MDWMTIGVIIWLMMSCWLFRQYNYIANERLKNDVMYRAGYAITALIWPVVMIRVIISLIKTRKVKRSH